MLPATSCALAPDQKKKKTIFCHRRGIDNFFRLFLHTRGQIFLYQTPGPRPLRITGRVVNTVSRGWVGAPNERAPFRIHDAVVGFALSIDVRRGL